MVDTWGIIDEKFEVATTDRIYLGIVQNLSQDLASTYSLNAKNMCRFQFYESLVRIANFKYKQPNLEPTVFDGLQ